jgi:hypothetical protein
MITLFGKAGDVNGVMFSKQTYPRVGMELSSRTVAQVDTFELHATVQNVLSFKLNRKTFHTKFDQIHLLTDRLIPVANMFVARPRLLIRYRRFETKYPSHIEGYSSLLGLDCLTLKLGKTMLRNVGTSYRPTPLNTSFKRRPQLEGGRSLQSLADTFTKQETTNNRPPNK